jgi:hypothetical protein
MKHGRRTIWLSAVLAAVSLVLAVPPARGDEPGKAGGEGRDAGAAAHAAAQSAADRRLLALEQAAARVQQLADARGALGAYFDEATGEHVVVVPASGPGAALTAADVRALGVAGRVERRDVAREAVDRFQARIAERNFHPRAADHAYGSWLDLTSGVMVVETDAPDDVVDELVAGFPGPVEVRRGAVNDDLGRRSDPPPHWGGTSITNGSSVCTAGFVVKNSSGTRYMVTAGHCFGLWSAVYNTGGGYHMGWVVRRGPIPPRDMELIGGKSYGSYVYGGDTTGYGRKVLSAGDPVVNFTGYCRSGQTTGERCGQKVTSVTAQVCTQSGCKSPVIAYSGGVMSAGGDSGAPFYLPSSGNGVYIRGMHIASGSSTMYAERWSSIAANYGVSIVT